MPAILQSAPVGRSGTPPGGCSLLKPKGSPKRRAGRATGLLEDAVPARPDKAGNHEQDDPAEDRATEQHDDPDDGDDGRDHPEQERPAGSERSDQSKTKHSFLLTPPLIHRPRSSFVSRRRPRRRSGGRNIGPCPRTPSPSTSSPRWR